MMPRGSLLIVILLASASCAADRGTLDLRRQLLEAEAERDALELEERLGKPGPPEQQRVELAEAAPKLNHIADRLHASHRARLEALDALLRDVRAERDTALQQWQETSQAVLDLEAQRERYEDEAARA